MALTFTPAPELGEKIPEFHLKGIDNQFFGKKDLSANSPVVVMFICNHCPYVQAIEDRLITLGAELKKQNVDVIAICSNDAHSHPEDSFENLQKRAREKNYSFRYLYDESQEVAKSFGAVCTPDFFVYDKSHRLAYRGRLDDSWKDPAKVSKRELYEVVQLLLKDQPLTEPQTASMGCSIKWI